jgi:hypothetical protein
MGKVNVKKSGIFMREDLEKCLRNITNVLNSKFQEVHKGGGAFHPIPPKFREAYDFPYSSLCISCILSIRKELQILTDNPPVNYDIPP